jgi:hypothetical protein
MPQPRSFALVASLLAVGVFAPPVLAASPRDELLRVAPPDAALVFVVQNARGHVRTIAKSPFAEWFPQSAVGKQVLAGLNVKQVRDSTAPVLAALGTTPDELLADVLGDAVAFAYTPPPPDAPMTGERAVILIRPGKPATLARLVERLNDIQTGNGEVKAVVRRQHAGAEYFERQKPGGSDFYCFRNGVFAFSGSEPDIKAVIDRDKAADKPSELAARFDRHQVSDAAVVALINPRPLDAALKARVANAKADEQRFLGRFEEVWLALDSAAVYLAPGTDLEAGVSLRFTPDKLPASARALLTGPRVQPAVWQAIPDTALFALAGQFKAADFVEAVGTLAPGPEKNPLLANLEKGLGPVFGKGRLPAVLEALGPNWALWAEPPAGDGFVPVAVAVVQIDATDPKGKEAARAVVRAVGFGFEAARVAYNTGHADQLELVETQDGDAVITSLVNEKGFPPGVRPSFAYKGGYLLLAGSPDAIKRFQEPKPASATSGEATIARFSGTATRAFFQDRGGQLAKFLSAAGHGDEKELQKQFEQFAAVLEVVDRIELVTRGDDAGVRVALRAKLTKSLK